MSDPGSPDRPDDATVDLLIQQVVEGLSPAEQRALDAWGTDASRERQAFEQAAAAVSLATALDSPLPAGLRARLERSAADYVMNAHTVTPLPTAPAAVAVATRDPRRGGGWSWLVAAACLILAVLGWMRTPQGAAPQVSQVPVAVPPTPEEQLATLAAKADTLKVALAATKDPASGGVSGTVVWDPSTQKGFIRFVGLAPNDPAAQQYQLWIFDGGRDARYPVDGGVFNIPANGSTVVIPIHAALPVLKAAAFAVTIEKPGGVVVSAREHVVALGAVST